MRNVLQRIIDTSYIICCTVLPCKLYFILFYFAVVVAAVFVFVENHYLDRWLRVVMDVKTTTTTMTSVLCMCKFAVHL